MKLKEAYSILGLDPGASPAELKAAYRDLVWIWHPDRVAGPARVRLRAEKELRKINEAYSRIRSEPADVVPDGPPVVLNSGESSDLGRNMLVVVALAALSLIAARNLYGMTESVWCWLG